MKNILTIVLILLIIQNSYTQCDNKVSTNPYSSNNNSLPDIIQSTPVSPYVQDNKYLNGLAWWEPNHYILDNMLYNPTQPYDIMMNIQPTGVTNYYSYLNKYLPGIEEMNPENGWELLLVNLGRYPDNINIHSFTDYRKVPYIVLYHKYKGIIRVFVQYGYEQAPLLSINGVKIDLFYNVDFNVSGLLRLGNKIDQPLDIETKVLKQSAVAARNSNNDYWMSADFQVTYDPCVCSFPTILNLDFEFFTQLNFSLYGRSITAQDDIINSNGNINNLDFLSVANFTQDQINGEGFIIYKNLQTLADDYIDKLNKYKAELALVNMHNKEIDNALLVLKVWKSVLTVGLAATTGTADWTELAGQFPNMAFLGTSDSTKVKAFYKEVLKILSKEIGSFVNKNFEKKKVPTQPEMPIASFSEMYFTGSLNQELLITGPRFNTPGSFVNQGASIYNPPYSNNVYGYPIYNQPLGIFSLLESPSVSISGPKKENYTCTNQIARETNFTNHYQYKIADDLKYALNTSLDIESHDIQAAIFVKGYFTGIETDPRYPGFNDSIFYSTEFSTNTISYDYYEESKAFTKDTITIQSVYIPIDALNNAVFGFGIKNRRIRGTCEPNWNGALFNVHQVILKLIVKVSYESENDQNEQHEYDYIFSYLIDEDNLTLEEDLFVNDLPGSNQNFNQFPKDLLLNNKTFNGSAIEGCILTGNQYLCKAWNEITIEGDLISTNNYLVDIVAGSQILVLNESFIDSEINLIVSPILDLSNPTPPVDRSYVFDFCNNTDPNYPGYKANQVPKIYWNNVEDSIEAKEEALESVFTINVYPNPAQNHFNISFDAIETGDMHLSIIDFSGRVVSNHLIPVRREGIHNEEFDINHLAKGIYFCNFRFNNQTFNIKLVKL